MTIVETISNFTVLQKLRLAIMAGATEMKFEPKQFAEILDEIFSAAGDPSVHRAYAETNGTITIDGCRLSRTDAPHKPQPYGQWQKTGKLWILADSASEAAQRAVDAYLDSRRRVRVDGSRIDLAIKSAVELIKNAEES